MSAYAEARDAIIGNLYSAAAEATVQDRPKLADRWYKTAEKIERDFGRRGQPWKAPQVQWADDREGPVAP